jgi:hypothetical protein
MGRMKDFDIRIRNGGDDAIAAVNELIHSWIPVSTRKPDDDVLVLGYWPASPFGGEPAIDIVFRRDGKWSGSELVKSPPTHWMLLPQRPVSSNDLRLDWHLSRLRFLPDEFEREFRARFPPSPFLDSVVYVLRNTVSNLESAIRARLDPSGTKPGNVYPVVASKCTQGRTNKPKSSTRATRSPRRTKRS